MRRPLRKLLAVTALVASLALGSAPAWADEHRPDDAGHPLRVAAYIVHPIGVILDTILFRPAHWLVSHEPLRTLFGHTEE